MTFIVLLIVALIVGLPIWFLIKVANRAGELGRGIRKHIGLK